MSDEGNNTAPCRGAAVLELALILPLLIFVLFGALEFARLARLIQFSAVLGREAASWAYRSCSDFDEPGGIEETSERTTACLAEVLGHDPEAERGTGLQSITNDLQPERGITIIVSVYHLSRNGRVNRVSVVGENSLRHHSTRFAEAGDRIDGPIRLDADFVRRRRRISIAEVYYPFVPLLNGVPTIGRLFGRFDYYDATLL